ncbi:nuclear segregation protein [Colletotrichum truncatum]|uniref:Nuclear segregation protein n=1 Tax=Colletotrichum truncatum TaxID=5467 RepID=A0ACC3ZJV2_COLTU|nr:nuclear segregation protein [Colletotrichum truncatum]KAF6799779.1 nuclear segregation protein [Colletotrichum truncatum]
MADTKQAPAAAADKEVQKTRPAMPDEAEFNKKLNVAQKELKEAEDKLTQSQKAIKAKIDLATPSKNKDQPSPAQKRRQELIAQLNEIRQKQGAGKNARTGKLDQIKRLDEQLRSRINEQKNAKSKVNFKSVEEVDRQIERLESQVNSGSMKIVDEKKALAEISSLRKLKKNFSQFDDSQKQIDDLKAKIKEIKDSMDDPEAKAMSEQYNKLQAELDAIKAEGDEAYKNLSSLRDERSKLHAIQNEKYQAVKTLKDEFYQGRKAAQAYEREAREKARERRKAEHDRFIKERKKADAEKFLAEASDPAYLEEIRRANSLLQFLDPSHKAEKAPLLADSGLSAQATRTVDDSGLKGMKIVSKKDRDEDYLPAAKKGKKGKKGGAAASDAGKFNCPPSVVEDCAFLNIDPPMSQSDVATVVEKVKAKLDHWKADQANQTQKNIEKAKKQLEKLEADEANGIDSNGDAVEEVTKDLKETSVEEKA